MSLVFSTILPKRGGGMMAKAGSKRKRLKAKGAPKRPDFVCVYNYRRRTFSSFWLGSPSASMPMRFWKAWIAAFEPEPKLPSTSPS